MTLSPVPSAEGVRTLVWVAASVRGSGGSFASAAVSCVWRSLSVPSVFAAEATTGNSACMAAMSVTGCCTSHWVSCALPWVCSRPSEPVVA